LYFIQNLYKHNTDCSHSQTYRAGIYHIRKDISVPSSRKPEVHSLSKKYTVRTDNF